MQEKFDEEKTQLHKEKEQFLNEQLEVKERVNKALHSMTIIEVQTKDQVP
jgi:hypothetical protein